MNSDTLLVISVQLVTTGIIIKNSIMFLLSCLVMTFVILYMYVEREEQRKIQEAIKKFKPKQDE